MVLLVLNLTAVYNSRRPLMHRNWRSSSNLGGFQFFSIHASFTLIIKEVKTTKADILLAELNLDRRHHTIQVSFGEILLHHMLESAQQLISAFYNTIILLRIFLIDGPQLWSKNKEGIKTWIAHILTDVFTPVIYKGQHGKPSWITFQLNPSNADIPGLYLENKYWMLYWMTGFFLLLTVVV